MLHLTAPDLADLRSVERVAAQCNDDVSGVSTLMRVRDYGVVQHYRVETTGYCGDSASVPRAPQRHEDGAMAQPSKYHLAWLEDARSRVASCGRHLTYRISVSVDSDGAVGAVALTPTPPKDDAACIGGAVRSIGPVPLPAPETLRFSMP